MTNLSFDDLVRQFIKNKLPLVTTLFRKVEIDDSATLQEFFEADDIAEMTEKFFSHFDIEPARFSLSHYFPWKTRSLLSRKPQSEDQKALTIAMYIESARAGKWLFDESHLRN